MIQVGVDISQTKKPKVVDAYCPEVYEFRESLNYRYPDWEEFVLGSHNNRLTVRFVRKGNEFTEVKKNLELMKLTMFLDKKYPKWRRFAITNKVYPEIKCADCEVGMLLRLSTSNAFKFIFVEEEKTDDNGVKQVIGNQEGERVVFSTKDRKKYAFSVLLDKADKEQMSLVFQEEAV